MIFEETLHYRHSVERREDLPLEWRILLSWVGRDKNILEVGCHTGDFSRWLKEAGCTVTGIEINRLALEEAKPFLTKAICGDIETAETWEQVGHARFDVILFEHVLEHLSDPWNVLKRSCTLLQPNGKILIALPNISNAETRFRMLFGNFDYTEIGVMDRTHLRFFNQKTVREMIENAGLKVEAYDSPWRVNPVREFLDHLPLLTHLRRLLPKTISGKSLFSPNLTDVVMLFNCTVK